MMNNLLGFMSSVLINNIYFAPIIAFIGGIIASFTPCNLAQIPLYLTVINIKENSKIKNKKNINKLNTIFYCLGNLIAFIILGVLIAYIGRIFSTNRFFYLLIGILMIIIFLDMQNIFSNNKCKSISKYINKFKKNKINAFLFGFISAIFASTCAMPILISILSIISVNKNIIVGIVSLILYSVGNLALIIICSISLKNINQILNNEKYNNYNKIIANMYSILIFILGLYMIYLGV